ncbi:unnamed protein product [Adineta ricciae]|uniref:Uncharacterized protein n=1 Tax=Adineta ricciae TaxID=249248 RepID=A0A815PHX3_ADIRI|nr:unnamed protein product [Adineta ricciae]CAF1566994.1 unnamed protein product [Adineta ricciae]
MSSSEVTGKERAFAAAAAASATPPSTPRRQSTNADQVDTKLTLPKAAYYVIFVEGCERFCFYGLKTILLLYFMHYLLLSKDTATSYYHLFSFACYFTPTIGAIISDGYIGRYSTILYLSVVYLIGSIILTLTAIPSVGHHHLVGPFIGLLLIALGTGGIKPCVSAFGADQISMTNPKQLNRYFAFFYFAINTGSLVSTLLTPLLRSKFSCFGYDCYSLAFGIPALLMLISIIIFILGTPLYKRVPPKENIIVKFIAINLHAIRNATFGPSTGSKEHWLYHANDRYSADDIEDVRCVLRVFLLFTPIPVFYALFDQSGSRWTYQATLMNGSLGPFGTIQPDQMQAMNSFFVLLFIPMFEEVIYPAFARCNLLIKPLQRMFVGMIVMVFAFVVAAILQSSIQSKSSAMPVRYQTSLFNGYNCTININNMRSIEPGKTSYIPCTKLLVEGVTFTSTCYSSDVSFKLNQDELCPSVLILSEVDDEERGKVLGVTTLANSIANQRGANGSALLRVVTLDGKQSDVETVPNKYNFKMSKKLLPTDYKSVLPTNYEIKNLATQQISAENFDTHPTAVYTVLLHNSNNDRLHATVFEDVPPFTIHILWQTVQYVLMTSAEILVSITGLVFAYSQAPRRYKSVIMSAWLLTTAIGDLIVVFVAEVHFVSNQVIEFVFFAILMAFGAFIFGVLAIRYTYYQARHDDSEDQQLILDKAAFEPEQIIE